MFDVPILFNIFRRRETALAVFAAIREIRPQRLFIAADGPRSHIPEEKIICEALRREILDGIDWECEVHTLFREKNLGCGLAVSGAVDWFFDNVESGIILEDDCLPSMEFFRFAAAALEYYRDDETVMHISGTQRIPDWKNQDGCCGVFTVYSQIWGWASWRRAWKHYDFHLNDQDRKKLFERLPVKEAKRFWELLTAVKERRPGFDTWDFQWTYAVIVNDGVALDPAVNLVRNIGAEDSTHDMPEMSNNNLDKTLSETLQFSDAPYVVDKKRDSQIFDLILKKAPLAVRCWRKIKRIYPKVEKLLAAADLAGEMIRTAFKCRSKGDKVLVLRADRLGDMVLFLPFLRQISRRYHQLGSKVYMLCRPELADLVRREGEVDFVEPFEAEKFISSRLYRKKTVDFLHREKFGILINPRASRELLVDEYVAAAAGAHQAWAIYHHKAVRNRRLLEFTARYYTEIAEVPANCIHEYQINEFFVSEFIPDAPSLQPGSSAFVPDEKEYICVFPGANDKFRRFGEEKFAAVIRNLKAKYPGAEIKICGSTKESDLCVLTALTAGLDVKSSVLLTADIDALLQMMKKCRLLLGNDSGAAHLAAYCGIPAVAVCGCGHAGRYYPYPEKHIACAAPPRIVRHLTACQNCDWQCTNDQPFYCITSISAEEVTGACADLLLQS